MNPFKDKEFIKRFFKVAFPVMVHAFILFIVSFVDNLMVGTVSNEAVSGVYAANQTTYIFLVTSMGILSGAGIFIQQFFGAKDERHLKQSFKIKLITSVLFLIIIIPLYYIFGSKVIWFYCHSDSNATIILEQGMEYLNIVIISYIPYMFALAYTSSLREIGRTKYAMIAGIIAFVSNVIFNSLFIYVFKMGVKGAAIATCIARTIELISIVIISKIVKFEFSYNILKEKDNKIEKELVKRIARKSVFLFLNEVFWVTGMVMISLAYAQREGVLSALAVVSTMSDVFGIVFQGLSVGIGVLVGGCLGANEFDKAKDYVKKFYVLGVIIALIATTLLVCFSPIIPLMFAEVSNEQKELASSLIRIYACYIPFFCICTSSYVILKTGGRTITTFILDSVLLWVLFIPTAWCLTLFTSLPLIFVYIAVQSCDVIKSVIGIIMVKQHKWVQNLTININNEKNENIANN